MTILWTDRAKAHLRDILDFIAFDNRDAAGELARKVFHAVGQLAEFPLAGRCLPEFAEAPFRERGVPPCRVIYLVREETVLILVVLRAEQRLRIDWLAP